MKKTVFVIGAGASKEANLPTGEELKDRISSRLYQNNKDDNISEDIWGALHCSIGQGKIAPYITAAHHIAKHLPLASSIDNFIDTHKEDKKIAWCGKLAIVHSILAAEKNSRLYFQQISEDSNIAFQSIQKTWYIPFFRILTEGRNPKDLEKRLQQITLIIFNYDRCVEHFLFCAIKGYYNLPEVEVVEILKNLRIYHPYGVVAPLCWQSKDKRTIGFGEKADYRNICEFAKNIKTFTEGTDPQSSEVSEIRGCMGQADVLVFLGFAFHELNMDLIQPQRHKKANHAPFLNCFATVFGASHNDQAVIKHNIERLYNTSSRTLHTYTAGLSCYGIFEEYARSLSF